MTEAMFLQIHGGGSSTMRMIELPAGPIRVGRGPQCEVRLPETSLADVQCILRLRGNTWHYQPVGPSGHVWIDGRPAEDPRNLAQGVPFRVGDHWLTLRSARNAFNDWVAPDEPVPVVPVPSTAESREIPDPEPQAGAGHEERPRSSTTADENEERLRRWQTRLEQRERWLKDRQDERRWEARWKSAGESIRARSTGPASPAREPVQNPPSRPIPTPRPAPAPVSKPTPRPILTPPVSRIIETRPSEPTRRVAEPSPRPQTTRPSVRPLPEPSLPRRTVEAPKARVPVKPTIRVVPPAPVVVLPAAPPISRAMVTLPSTSLERPTVRVNPVEVVIPPQVVEHDPPAVGFQEPAPETVSLIEPKPVEAPSIATEVDSGAPASFFETVEIEEIEQILAAEPTPVEEVACEIEPDEATAVEVQAEAMIEDVQDELEAGTESALIDPSNLESESFHIESHHEWSSTEIATPQPMPTGRIEPSIWVDELTEAEEEAVEVERGEIERAPNPVDQEPVETDLAPGRWVEPLAVQPTIEIGTAKTDYPSARAIFAAQGRRVQPTQASATPTSPRRRPVEPEPTDFRSPAQWSIPLWLGGLPAVAAALFLGSVGLALVYEWTIEAGGANTGLKIALRPSASASPVIDPSLIPRGGWWFSNSTHLAAWAVAIERADDGEDRSEDGRSLLVAAREASPLGARARFTIEARPGSNAVPLPNDYSEIGRTRDIVSLSGTGRRLRETGKVEASIRAYRSALEIALQADRAGLDPPVFDENNQMNRYALPHEALVTLVVRNMAETGDWTIDQWTSVLPPSAVASWVASKVLVAMQKKVEGDALADLSIRQAESPPLAGSDPAEHHAAVAEALAFRGRWTDASEQYRRAIDQVEDDATRRAWWLNLSELAHRMSDSQAQSRAIEAAQSPDTVDEITSRARKAQETLTPSYSPDGRR